MLELIQLVTLHYYHLSNLCAIPRCQITNFVFIHLNTHTHTYMITHSIVLGLEVSEVHKYLNSNPQDKSCM